MGTQQVKNCVVVNRRFPYDQEPCFRGSKKECEDWVNKANDDLAEMFSGNIPEDYEVRAMGLTPEQAAEVKSEMVPNGTPVRFQINGQTICNLTTGALQPKGINVIHQTVYWSFTKETSKKIANWLGAKAVFCE